MAKRTILSPFNRMMSRSDRRGHSVDDRADVDQDSQPQPECDDCGDTLRELDSSGHSTTYCSVCSVVPAT